MCTVMKVQVRDTSSGCVSVPEPSFEQFVHEVRTERVDESTKKMHPTVDLEDARDRPGMSTQTLGARHLSKLNCADLCFQSVVLF